MCIFISCAVSQFCCSFIMCILQVCRNRQISGGLYLLHCLKYCFTAAVALRCRGNIGYCLRQNDLCLRHSYPFHRQRCIDRYHQCLRICISHILRSTDHDTSCDKSHTLSCIQHPCQIINRRIRIRPPHTFDKCGNGIVMIVTIFIISCCSLLNTLLCHIQSNVNLPVSGRFSSHNSQFNGIQRVSGISTGDIRQEIQRIFIYGSVIGTHSAIRIVDRFF